MQDMDRTIASGNTIKLPVAPMRPHLIVLYPQNQFKQIPLEKGTVVLAVKDGVYESLGRRI